MIEYGCSFTLPPLQKALCHAHHALGQALTLLTEATNSYSDDTCQMLQVSSRN